ncbi:unnamed protein product [Mucor fragilis]
MKLVSWATLVSTALCAHAFELGESFRQPKNILFGSVGGGSTHINWVLSILDALADRGHNVTFVTHDNEVKYGLEHPNLNTVSIGRNDVDLSIPGNRKRHTDNALFLIEVYNAVHTDYDTKMHKYKDIVEGTHFDVALCDHFTIPCVDIAQNVDIPLIITTALAISQDATASYINNFLESNDTTTADMSFIQRMIAKVVEPVNFVLDLKPVIDDTKKMKKELGWLPLTGMPAFEDNWKNSLKIVNNLFGFEPARPLGPLVELVGPIMSKSYPDLTDDHKQFLASHSKVAYVAFGQSVEIEDVEIELVLRSLVDAIESGALDGFIWAMRNSIHLFPHNIVSSTNQSYLVQDMLQGRYKHAQFVTWAPQMAILSHPHTQLFVSHAGLGSLHEAAYAGVRTALYPFYGDQMSNAYMMRTQHLGVQLNQGMSQDAFSQEIDRVARDVNGTFQRHVDRFQAMVQIHAQHGVARAADLVEEVLFASDNGKLPHRYPASRDMSFIKARNLDLWGFWVVFAMLFVVFACYTFYNLYDAALVAKDSYKIRKQQKAHFAQVRESLKEKKHN